MMEHMLAWKLVGPIARTYLGIADRTSVLLLRLDNLDKLELSEVMLCKTSLTCFIKHRLPILLVELSQVIDL